MEVPESLRGICAALYRRGALTPAELARALGTPSAALATRLASGIARGLLAQDWHEGERVYRLTAPAAALITDRPVRRAA
jgi:DNA-binding MarR family transcriptional regulator